MSGGSLSQEEIDALLKAGAGDDAPPAGGGAPADPEPPVEPEAVPEAVAGPEAVPVPEAAAPEAVPVPEAAAPEAVAEPEATAVPEAVPPAAAAPDDDLDASERDTIGEVGNICMSSAATALSTLLGRPVQITTPAVAVVPESEVRGHFGVLPAVVVRIEYTEGLDGQNVFILSTRDASVVADLMMGGEGSPSEEFSDLHASAIAEAMNQMMGSASTAMAEMVGRRVDISAPQVQILDLSDDASALELGLEALMVRTAFQLRVGDLLDTTLMQLMPLRFAHSLADGLLASAPSTAEPPHAPEAPAPAPAPAAEPPAPAAAAPAPAAAPGPAPPPPAEDDRHLHALPAPPVAQPVSFPSLDEVPPPAGGSDISLLIDVPLQVTVELGRTSLKIRNVLELVPGSIVELDKLAGDLVDVLVNGKQIARGEVVVIDEEFGVRISEVASQAKRLRGLAAGEA